MDATYPLTPYRDEVMYCAAVVCIPGRCKVLFTQDQTTWPSVKTSHIRMAKLFPQKRHRRTALRSSCMTHPRSVAGTSTIPDSPTALGFSAVVRSESSAPEFSSPPPSCWGRERTGGRKAFRAQPRQVCTIVVERINDVTEQRADVGRSRQKQERRPTKTSA